MEVENEDAQCAQAEGEVWGMGYGRRDWRDPPLKGTGIPCVGYGWGPSLQDPVGTDGFWNCGVQLKSSSSTNTP